MISIWSFQGMIAALFGFFPVKLDSSSFKREEKKALCAPKQILLHFLYAELQVKISAQFLTVKDLVFGWKTFPRSLPDMLTSIPLLFLHHFFSQLICMLPSAPSLLSGFLSIWRQELPLMETQVTTYFIF